MPRNCRAEGLRWGRDYYKDDKLSKRDNLAVENGILFGRGGELGGGAGRQSG